MSVELKKYRSVDNTVQNMYMLVNEFKDDPRLQVFSAWSLKRIFNYISKTIPYVPDPTPGQVAFLKGDAVEALKSPFQTMYNGGDCDDKSILAACIFEVKKIPYRFTVVSTKKDKQLHHVYLEILYNSVWVPFDATYPQYELFWENPFTKKKIYELSGNSLHISEAAPTNTKCRTCVQPCLSGTRSNQSLKNNYAAQLLGSGAHAENINGVQLAILRGIDNSKCNCASCNCTSCKKRAGCSKRYKTSARDKAIINTGRKQLLGAALGLGDPVTVVTTIATVASALFGGLFKKEAYQDAYNAWAQAESQLVGLSAAADRGDQNALQQLVVLRAMIAVLSRDFMNKPMGADVCTSAGRCGNRAEWSKIQADVEAKAAAFAPFMLWLHNENYAGRSKLFSLESMVSYYDQFKSKSGLYNDFETAQRTGQNKTKSGNTPGQLKFSGAGLLLLAGAVAVAFKLKSKK